MTTTFGFGILQGARCSAEDYRQFHPNASTTMMSRYEFAFEELADATEGANPYFWHVEDAATGTAILDCGSDVTNSGNESFAYCPLARVEPGYQCASLPATEGCRRVVLLLPGIGGAQVAVDGRVVAEQQHQQQLGGASPQQANDDEYAISNFYSFEVGADCPTCPSDDDVLLEVYMRLYEESRSRLSLRLVELPSHSPPPNASSIVLATFDGDYESLAYTRQCVASTQCHRLTMSLPPNPDGSEYFFPIPTVVTLGGVYYVDHDVHFLPAHNESSLAYSAVIGNCTATSCSDDVNGNRNGKKEEDTGTSSLLTVTMDTRGVRTDVEPGVGAWFVYDSAGGNVTSSEALGRTGSWFHFGRGYRANETLRAHECVPSTNATHLTLAVLNRLPGGVALTVEKDGETLPCREEVPDGGRSPVINVTGDNDEKIEVYPWEVLTTPLDGSCSTSTGLSGGAIAGIVIGAVLGTLVLVSVIWKLFSFSKRRSKKDASIGA